MPILKADNGHLVEATSMRLVVIYSGCFAKPVWTTIGNVRI